jgi:hypothetical protein
MAYNVYAACDKCGESILSFGVNHPMPITRAVYIARKRGWSVGKKGWICPDCRKAKKKPHSTTGSRENGGDTNG